MASRTTIAREHRDRYLLLLALISITFILVMLVDFEKLDTLAADLVAIGVSLLTAATLVVALWTSAASRRLIRAAALISGLAVLSIVAAIATETPYRPSILWVLLLALAPIVVIRRIASHEEVSVETIIGAICAYLLIALAFSYVFLVFDSSGLLFFGTEQPSTAFPYFSLVTITTLGYGDLAPATEAARALATMEAMIGQVFLVIFVARMVSLYGGRWQRVRRAEVD